MTDVISSNDNVAFGNFTKTFTWMEIKEEIHYTLEYKLK